MRLIDTTQRRGRPSGLMSQIELAPGAVVVAYSHATGEDPACHERVTRNAIAEKLARLKGCQYAGDYDAATRYEGAVYFVPRDTVVGADAARVLGIRSEDDLFGGVVPLPFVATKSITHPLVDAGACEPPGWSRTFPRAVRAAVLPGVSAFSPEDACRGGRRLLEQGPVRVKPGLGVGGRGQTLVEDTGALEAAVAALDVAELACYGVALERHLANVTTYSVGQVRVGGFVATYFGTQKLTQDNGGASVYGGSDLTVARGGFDALLALDIDDGARRAIAQARVYDAAAEHCFERFAASRRNYDIVRGRGPRGEIMSGVLEQSWRIGGASSAEIAALEAFSANPALNAVRAECSEVYGEGAAPPPCGATTYFRGVDPTVGYITKYTTLAPYADA
jgi:hypothetical protein